MTTDMKEYALAETKRHKPCLIYRGYRYVQDKIQNRTIYWRCEDRSHCNGRAHQLIDNESLPILTIKHNHVPLIEDLSRHDIISVDSHRRQRRRRIQNIHSKEKNDLTMTSTIKLENNSNRHQHQHAMMMKNLHLSEVIRTTTTSQFQPYSMNGHSTMNSIDMTKLLSNIATISNRSSMKTNRTCANMDYPSCLNHFSWEEIEGRYVPVIFRNENGIAQRYTSKMYVENTLFQSESWQRHLTLARSLPPLVSYSYTEHELNLFRNIISWHLASFYFKTLPSTDCLIRFEDLWEFYTTLRKLRDSISTTSINRSIVPLPSTQPKSNFQSQSYEKFISAKPNSIIEKPAKESGWVQINNVFVPYIIKTKQRDNGSIREFYIPYEILIKCNIFTDGEYSLKKFLIKATQQDFDLLNHLITNINIFDEKIPDKTLLVNLYHIMIGLNRILYIKFLPMKQPRTQVNRYHAEVLTHKGGTLLMNGNKYIPYIVQNNRFYVPLMYTFHSLPNFLIQAKRNARIPRQYEIDYLNLLLIYFSIDHPPLTSDTLLVDIFNIKSSNLQTPIHYRTLHEHQQFERNRLLNSIVHSTSISKSSTTSTLTNNKMSKCTPTNVVVNPMIHHPSFYGLTNPNTTLTLIKPLPEMKMIHFNNRLLNAIVKSPDLSNNDWKISIQEIFQQFSYKIDYEKFLQWTQTNHLLPLIKLDDDEKKYFSNYYNNKNEYYIQYQHLDRCFALLNDLQRGAISMTLLPTNNPNSIQSNNKSSLAGAKKRKMTLTTTAHHTSPISMINESNSMPKIPHIEESSIKSPIHEIPNEQVIGPIVDDDDMMPIVASVEEEQPIIDETNPSIKETTVFIVESVDDNDERIRLDDVIPSSIVNNSTSQDNDKHKNERIQTTNSSDHRKKSIKKRQRNGYVKSRSRSRSLTPRFVKKTRLLDNENNSLIMIITNEKIEQHLRTLYLTTDDNKRTRTRPVKIPTRLVEEIDTLSVKTVESDSNVFDILSSSTSTDIIDQTDLTENSSQSCTYNIVATTKTTKLGLTIKKVVQT